MPQKKLSSIIEKLFQHHHLLSAKDILEKLKKTGLTYNKTSIYRTLDQLLEKGVVCRHYFNEAQAVYESSDHHHTHLVCNKCGKIDAIECTYTQPTEIKKFEVDHHHVTLMGTCADCKKI